EGWPPGRPSAIRSPMPEADQAAARARAASGRPSGPPTEAASHRSRSTWRIGARAGEAWCKPRRGRHRPGRVEEPDEPSALLAQQVVQELAQDLVIYRSRDRVGAALVGHKHRRRLSDVALLAEDHV